LIAGSGAELKLTPVGTKIEARLRGPSITPGYLNDEALTRAAFDEEGFYRLGDAMRFVSRDDPAKGLLFDGRLAEDFKLSTGTWVSVGPLRAKFLAVSGGYAQDVVIAGHDREFVAALIFPNLQNCSALCPELDSAAPAAIVEHPQVRHRFQVALDELTRQSTGMTKHIVRAIVLDQPPSIDARGLQTRGRSIRRPCSRTVRAWSELCAPSHRRASHDRPEARLAVMRIHATKAI
jgi:feruloyl-CoA synthase